MTCGIHTDGEEIINDRTLIRIQHIFLTGLLLLLSVIPSRAQRKGGEIRIPFRTTSGESFTLRQTGQNRYSLEMNLPRLILVYENADKKLFLRINLPQGSVLSGLAGQPSLPSLSGLIGLPGSEQAQIRITSLDTQRVDISAYDSALIIPNLPSARKNTSGELPFYIDSIAYAIDTLSGKPLIEVSSAGTMRGSMLGRITVNPFRYNPVKNLLQVVTHLSAEIIFPEGTAAPYSNLKFASPAFHSLFRDRINALKSASPLPGQHPMKYVILSDPSFRSALQPFIQWKTQQGFKVIEVYKGSPGVGTTAADMKAYLKSLYLSATEDDPAPSYLLIVGDNEQIPAFYSSSYGHYTDLYYAEYDGGDDYIPDVFYGRFSAIDSQTLANQVEKTVEYEKYLFPDPSFLDSAILISTGNDGHGEEWGNGQINYESNLYFNAANGIFAYSYLYPASALKSNDIILHINNGSGFVNYTGHGYPTYWESPYFGVGNINALTNSHKYPLVVSNGCVTNYFMEPVCFGEALLRGKDKGAIGHIGCTDDSYWDEDYYWAVGSGPIVSNPTYEETKLGAFDRTFHTHGEPRIEWYPAQGQMTFAGNLAVQESGSRRARYYWEIYHLLGDPSLMVYYGRPKDLQASFPLKLPAGANQLILHTEPESYAGLSLRDSLLNAAACDSSGILALRFNPVKTGDTLMLVITKQNRKPLIVRIPVYASQDPFITLQAYAIASEDKDPDGRAENGETLGLNVQIRNVGASVARNIALSLTSSDPWVTISDSAAAWKYLDAATSAVVPGAFILSVKTEAPDQHIIPLDLHMSDRSGHTWDARFSLQVNTPVLLPGPGQLSDSAGGNGDGWPQPGENVEVTIPVTNAGHGSMEPSELKVTSASPGLQMINNFFRLSKLEPDSTCHALFSLHICDTLRAGASQSFTVSLDTAGVHLSKIITLYPGGYNEDFETGTLNKLPWKNTGSAGWYVTNASPLSGNYTARSGKITDNQYTEMAVTLYITDTGNIRFTYKVSSEDYYDFLYFYVDSQQRLNVSGQTGILEFADTVSPGWHTFRWRYQKDMAYSYGSDCAWVDNIVFPPSILSPFTDAGLKSIIYPSADSLYFAPVFPVAEVRNYGSLPIDSMKLIYRMNDTLMIQETLKLRILPGNTHRYTFEMPFLPPVKDTIRLKVSVSLPADSIPGNDSLSEIFFNRYEGIPSPAIALSRFTTDLSPPGFGEWVQAGVHLKNYGNLGATRLSLHLQCSDGYILLNDSILQYGTFPPGADSTLEKVFSFNVSPLAPNGHTCMFVILAQDSTGRTWQQEFTVKLVAPVLSFGPTWFDDSEQGNGNGTPDPGESLSFHAKVANTGSQSIDHLSVLFSADKPWITCTANPFVSSRIDTGKAVEALFPLQTGISAQTGEIVKYTMKIDTLSFHMEKTISRRVGCVTEDFETGNLLRLPWMTAGSSSWYVSGDSVYEGCWAARSGQVGKNQSSGLTLRLYITSPGTLGFMYRMSSSDLQARFSFTVDGQTRMNASGITGWQPYADTISAGWHEFTFLCTGGDSLQQKDFGAYLDNVYFPPSETTTGSDLAIVSVLYPDRDTIFPDKIHPVILVKNWGETAVDHPHMGVTLNHFVYAGEEIPATIYPGNLMVYTMQTPLRLLPQGEYEMKIFTDAAFDIDRTNDTVTLNIRNDSPPGNPSLPLLYPNPVKDVLQVILPAQTLHCTVEIDDTFGRKVAEFTFKDVPFGVPVSFDLSGLSAGMYIAVIHSDAGKYSRKFIKG